MGGGGGTPTQASSVNHWGTHIKKKTKKENKKNLGKRPGAGGQRRAKKGAGGNGVSR